MVVPPPNWDEVAAHAAAAAHDDAGWEGWEGWGGDGGFDGAAGNDHGDSSWQGAAGADHGDSSWEGAAGVQYQEGGFWAEGPDGSYWVDYPLPPGSSWEGGDDAWGCGGMDDAWGDGGMVGESPMPSCSPQCSESELVRTLGQDKWILSCLRQCLIQCIIRLCFIQCLTQCLIQYSPCLCHDSGDLHYQGSQLVGAECGESEASLLPTSGSNSQESMLPDKEGLSLFLFLHVYLLKYCRNVCEECLFIEWLSQNVSLHVYILLMSL